MLDRTGKILSATGELAGQTSIASTIYFMLQDAAKVMSTEGKVSVCNLICFHLSSQEEGEE